MHIPVSVVLPCIWKCISCHTVAYTHLCYGSMMACGCPRENPAPLTCWAATASSKHFVPCTCCKLRESGVVDWPVCRGPCAITHCQSTHTHGQRHV
ncbi:hypothetical protein BJV77DRAFT_421924 [Russula vinacea]|nr:hypothetical protein BJV77DRAFT_421924 [Russula vinacea]